MSFQNADLCDQFDAEVRVVAPMFHSFGGKPAFSGPITTLKVFEDNSLVRTALEGAGNGRVLVIDGGGSMRCAMVGDQLAVLAVNNGWAGIVVYGCIRDAKAISNMPVGVFALGTHPRKSVKKGAGDADIPVTFGGVTFTPGEMLYADEDGVIVASRALI
ncbi:ribonuclease E activity regulator RraA [Denitromonas ohlonensis]|uniref:4-hydroxy-4-methyl-2-oxoglutarate aldolase n=2 Tax=Denitromonas TaxID=139331 RepID=A0A557SG31_9RHOO|nr:ribonuclease E activity regulator RraA [Denitromonas ohlonensis]TVT48017.1 MAG: RraA family protein [Denitromonas halophila]TVO59552.1 RraA family protein [Denitromonas ohlonensis]TVO76376.1 RraA family protein [Denitromonas ohlonensis]TVT69155.1 MAG: RraA family protein [Denitromonas halophila]TVT76524.1 MAG: RraA family protein [Denitromonas halophila]